MKNLILILTLSTISLAAAAQGNSNTDTVTISGQKARIVRPSHYVPMQVDEFYKYKGTYDLSNGKTLALYDRVGLLFAKIEDERSHRILYTGSNTFVAKDEHLKITLNPQENGEVTGELIVARTPDTLANNVLAAEKFSVVASR